MICYKCDKCLTIHESLGEMTNLEFSHAGTASVNFPRNGKFLICNNCRGEFLKILHAYSRANNVDEAESEVEDTTLIRVGDIVISDSLFIDKKREIVLGITTGVDGNPWASLYSQDYPVPQMMPISSLKKTGEHIDVLGFFNNALKNAANIKEDEVNIPDRITLNPDRIESGSLNFETKMCEDCPVVIAGTHDQNYSIQFFDNTEVKKSWNMRMTKEQFKGIATGIAQMLGEITGGKEND